MFSSQSIEKWDFTVFKEDWSRYRVIDGSQLKLRVAVTDLWRTKQLDMTGYPTYHYFVTNLVSLIVPQKLIGKPSFEPVNPTTEKPEEFDFEEIDVKEQEYHTNDGFKIIVKPVLQKVFRYANHNIYGEPQYQINAQSTSNIKKIVQKPVDDKIE